MKLLSVVESGDVTATKNLLKSCANIEARDSNGQTPLIIAAEMGNLEIIRVLVNRGAAIDAREANQNTALMQAADEGQVRAFRLLLDLGANFNAKNMYGFNSLDLVERVEKPATEDDALTIHMMIKQAMQREKLLTPTLKLFRGLYRKYVSAFRLGHWKDLSRLLSSSFAVIEMDGERMSKHSWLLELQGQFNDRRDELFDFRVKSVRIRGEKAVVSVVAFDTFTQSDTWVKTRQGWLLQSVKLTGIVSQY